MQTHREYQVTFFPFHDNNKNIKFFLLHSAVMIEKWTGELRGQRRRSEPYFHHELREQYFMLLFLFLYNILLLLMCYLVYYWGGKYIFCKTKKEDVLNEYNVTPMEWKITSGTTSVDAIFMYFTLLTSWSQITVACNGINTLFQVHQTLLGNEGKNSCKCKSYIKALKKYALLFCV